MVKTLSMHGLNMQSIYPPHLCLSLGASLTANGLLQRVHIRGSCGIDLSLHYAPDAIIQRIQLWQIQQLNYIWSVWGHIGHQGLLWEKSLCIDSPNFHQYMLQTAEQHILVEQSLVGIGGDLYAICNRNYRILFSIFFQNTENNHFATFLSESDIGKSVWVPAVELILFRSQW